MGSSSSRKSNEPEYLKDLIETSQKIIKKYQAEKDDTIRGTKEEIVKYLNSKDISSSKKKIEIVLKAEDDIIIYNILNHCLQTLKEKTTSLSENKECPLELKAPLNTIIYAAPKFKIKELKEFRDVFKGKYGSKLIDKIDDDEDHFVNEVLIEKLNNNNYSEQLIKIRLKLLCQEKKIDSQFLDNMNQPPLEESNNSKIKKVSTIRSSFYSRLSRFPDESAIHPEEIEKSQKKTESINKKENTENKEDKYLAEFQEIERNNPLERVKTIEEPNEILMVMKEGENMFLPYDEKIDEKCYNINKIENWADSFYNLKKGIILEKYKELLSKSEYNKFFEALNYEYGINNCPLDLKKAFDIYKTAADTTTDTLSMYRLYHIYKKDFKKFDIKERCHVLEKFYIMKCFAYLTTFERENSLFERFCLFPEIKALIMDENNYFYDWYSDYYKFLQKNFSDYNITEDDAILIEAVNYYYFEKRDSTKTEEIIDKLLELIKKGNPHAMYFITNLGSYDEYYKKLYDMNYYRSFADYAKIMTNEEKEKALTMLKKSISNGYIDHIKEYFKIFMMNNEIEDIIKSPTLKSELIFIINYLLDNIILDRIDFLFDLIYMRNVLIKHYNFENEFKNNFDNLLKEIINYLNNFVKGTDEENKNKIKLYFNQDYYSLIYTLYGNICYFGIKGIVEKNYNETLNKFNFLLKNDEGFLLDRFYLSYIYIIKNKQRKIKNESNKSEDKELIELEKKLLNLFYIDVSVEKIKTYPPSFFYYLSRLFRNNTLKTKDLILEYVFLNRASNATIMNLKDVDCQIFGEKYLIYKAKKKIKEKNKEENFKKLLEEKGAINVEGYGEDGKICPICLENKKSIIALPCKHFFCGSCMKRLLDDGTCPICRTEIKITFDINLKKESLIKSKVFSSGDDPFRYSGDEDPFVDDPFGNDS